jgi:HK97 family phage prohead protease
MTAVEVKGGQSAFELKADGSFAAVVSTFGVVDHHLDVVMPGAFPVGQRVAISEWNHSLVVAHTQAAAGVGVLDADDVHGLVRGTLFLDRPEGRAAYARLKQLGGAGQWSYAFTPISREWVEHDGLVVRLLKELAIYECSPVTQAASLGTATVALKSAADLSVLGWAWHDAARLLVAPDGRTLLGPFLPVEVDGQQFGLSKAERRELQQTRVAVIRRELERLHREERELMDIREWFLARRGA